jgi:integration host factor subunit alpha
MRAELLAVSPPGENGCTVTKALIAEQLFREIGLNRREAKDLIEMLFEQISQTLQSGGSVKLSGFGNFELRSKKERPGRNPKTGREIPIRARRVVTFRPGQKLKLKVRTYVGSES